MATRPAFKQVRFREGYDIAEVDEFLDSIELRVRELPGPHPAVVEEIRNARFTPVRLKTGYEMRGVDEYLDELIRIATAGRG